MRLSEAIFKKVEPFLVAIINALTGVVIRITKWVDGLGKKAQAPQRCGWCGVCDCSLDYEDMKKKGFPCWKSKAQAESEGKA